MQLTINIDETMFKDVVEKELGAFSHEELHDIIKQCIVKFLTEGDTIRQLLVKEQSDSYSRYYKSLEPTKLFESAVKSMDFSEDLKEVKEAFTKCILENFQSIVTELIGNAIAKQLADKWQSEGWLEGAMMAVIRSSANRDSH